MKCFVNGVVRTMHDAIPRAEAVVTKGGRIVFVGVFRRCATVRRIGCRSDRSARTVDASGVHR